MKYIVVDADGLITNAIEWDGEAEWSPPEGQTAIQSEDGAPGDSYIDGAVVPAPIPEPEPEPEPVPEPEPEPKFEELVAQASSFADLKRLVAEKLA